MSADEEIRFIRDALRLLGHDVQTRLLARGWAVTDLEVPDDEALEWFWPPTAPAGSGEQRTPWRRPTRITRSSSGWRVEFGAAIAQQPDPPREYGDDEALFADLEGIECWPMTVAEAQQLWERRIMEVTVAMAHDDHYRGMFLTEPYTSRLRAIQAHQAHESDPRPDRTATPAPTEPRHRGDLSAQATLVDAEAWASAVRTARAGGEGWTRTGPDGG